MNKQTAYHLLFNSVGVLLGLFVVGYVVYSTVHTEDEPPCSTRYPAAMGFALQANDGAPLSPLELQARAGLREWGVNENASVVPVAEAPGGAALQVKLATLSSGEDSEGRARNGIDFHWSVAGAKAASSACLSYSVWLPDGFAFNNGGVLPGIVGGKPDNTSGFGTRVEWHLGGGGALAAALAGSNYRAVNQRDFPLRQGHWMKLEQELVLNTPGERNGRARLWVDGQLTAEGAGLQFRSDADAMITGVRADIGYRRAPPKAGELRLSAFEIAWR